MGRTDELAQIDEIFQTSERAVISAIAGMGGVGKTQLATQYALKHQAQFPGGVCWLNGRTGDVATQVILKAELDLHLKGLEQAKERLVEPDKILQWCWQHWEPSGRVLVVLDDTVDWAQDRRLLPAGDRFRVLVTTRQQDLLPKQVTIALNVLQPEEALNLLASLEQFGRVVREREQAERLCAALGYLPLGIELVGCYLAHDRHLTIATVFASLQARGMEDPALERSPEDDLVAQRGVKAAFDLTWDTLEPEAQKVARLLSYFALDWVAWDWVEAVMQQVEGETYTLGGLKARLENASLVQFEDERPGWCRLHPLIRQYVQEAEAAAVQALDAAPLRSAFTAAMLVGASQMPQNPTKNDIEGFQSILPHVQEMAECYTDGLAGEFLTWPFVALGRFYKGQGLYHQAKDWFAICLRMTQARFDENHPVVASSLNNLAYLYQEQGRLSDAEPLYRKALEIRQRLFDGDHPDVATSLNNLAYLCQEQGHLSNAEQLFRQALEMRQRLFDSDHPDVATSLNNLAYLCQEQGHLSNAERLYYQALEMTQRLFDSDHPAVATSLNNLAYLYQEQGRLSDAESLFCQALEMMQRLFDGDHPAVATNLNNVAYLYQVQGRLSNAEVLFRQSLEMTQRLFNGDHPDVARNLHNLAGLYKAQGRLSNAELLFRQALEMFERTLGTQHPSTEKCRKNLNACLQ
ncbi:MAG TPA: tetratricopeptide repeat protein [Stenomitos sp.]